VSGEEGCQEEGCQVPFPGPPIHSTHSSHSFSPCKKGYLTPFSHDTLLPGMGQPANAQWLSLPYSSECTNQAIQDADVCGVAALATLQPDFIDYAWPL